MDQATFDLITRIANDQSKKTFSYYSREDIRQEIWAICIKCLPDYDPLRGELEHYLRSSVKNALINRFVAVTKKIRVPCKRCPFFNKSKEIFCGKFGIETSHCSKYSNYLIADSSKDGLINSIEDSDNQFLDKSASDHVISAELKTLILSKLDEKLKIDFESYMNNSRLPRKRLNKLTKAVGVILKEANYNG